MDLRTSFVGRAWLVASLFLQAAAVSASAAAEDDSSALANVRTYGELFVAGKQEQAAELMSETLRAAMSPEAAQQLRTTLIGASGALREIGQPWLEDRVQGYRRFRLPLVLERTTLDLRVVVDGDDRVAGLFVVPHLAPPAERAAVSAPVAEVDVRVSGPLGPLPGTLSLPRGDGPHPAVVLVHGSGPNDRDETVGPNKPFRDLAWGLTSRGIAVLRYDKRSYASPATLVALGDALTVRQETVDDARAALALLRGRSDIDPQRLYLIGHSLGAMVAPRIAATDPPPAGVVVMAGPARPLPETTLRQYRYIAGLDGTVTQEEQTHIDQVAAEVVRLRAALSGDAPAPEGPILGVPFGYYRDLDKLDPPAAAAALDIPLLVLQGGRDYQVTLDDFALWRAALADRPRACLTSYDALDHLFREGRGPGSPSDYETLAPVAPQVIADIAAWIHGDLSTCAPAKRTGSGG